MVLRNTLTREFNNSNVFEDSLRIVCKAIVAFYEASGCTILLENREETNEHQYVPVAGYHMNTVESSKPMVLGRELPIIQEVCVLGKGGININVASEDVFMTGIEGFAKDRNVKDMIAVPIKTRKATHGLIIVCSNQFDKQFMDYDLAVLKSVSYQIGTFIEANQLMAFEKNG